MRLKGSDRYFYNNVGIPSERFTLLPNKPQVSAVCIP